nr:hypothetical protein [Tanacetum cinerariifolium]
MSVMFGELKKLIEAAPLFRANWCMGMKKPPTIIAYSTLIQILIEELGIIMFRLIDRVMERVIQTLNGLKRF